MIGQLAGTVSAKTSKGIVLQVGGVGFVVQLTPADLSQTLVNEPCTVSTYLAVRENSLELFGFKEAMALRVFERLLTLPKVGPRTALATLSVATPKIIIESVLAADPDRLADLSGLSPARAEKIVAGLKGKVDDLGAKSDQDGTTASSAEGETLEALRALGYSAAEARRALRQAPTEGGTAERLRAALRQLNRHG